MKDMTNLHRRLFPGCQWSAAIAIPAAGLWMVATLDISVPAHTGRLSITGCTYR